MIRHAEIIRDWPAGEERTHAAETHVRQALFETPSRISQATQYRVYSILSFVMPDDAWRAGDQVPVELLEEQARYELEHQRQLEQRSCPECGDGVCQVDRG